MPRPVGRVHQAHLPATEPLVIPKPPNVTAQLLGACGAEWGVAPPSIFEQLRAFAMTPQCQLPLRTFAQLDSVLWAC